MRELKASVKSVESGSFLSKYKVGLNLASMGSVVGTRDRIGVVGFLFKISFLVGMKWYFEPKLCL